MDENEEPLSAMDAIWNMRQLNKQPENKPWEETSACRDAEEKQISLAESKMVPKHNIEQAGL